MSTNDIYDDLAATDIFANVDASFIKEIAKTAYLMQLQKGDVLIKEHSIDQYMYAITKGMFSVYKHSDHVDQVTDMSIITLKKGDVVGEMAFLDNGPRSANVIALEDSEVIVIPFEELRKNPSPVLYLNLNKILSQNIRDGNKDRLDSLKKQLHQARIMANMGHFIVYVLSLIAFYNLALRLFTSIATNPYTSTVGSTVVIFIFTVVLGMLVKHMKYPLSDYGVNCNQYTQAIKESLIYTTIFIIIITGMKWVYVVLSHSPIAVIDPGAAITAAQFGTKAYYIWLVIGIIVYGVFVILQEFVSRGVIQSSLENFLQMPNKQFIANFVTSGIFAAMHVHLSPNLALIVFFPSLFWGWLFNKHHTLVSPIISHILIGWWAIFGLGIEGLFR